MVLREQAGLAEDLIGVSLGREEPMEPRGICRGIAKGEALYHLVGYPPPPEIIQGLPSHVRLQEDVMERALKALVKVKKRLGLPLFPSLGAALLAHQLHAGFRGKELHRLQEAQMLHLLDKCEHVAGFLAREAMVEAILVIDREGRRLLVSASMERALGPMPPAPGDNRDEPLHDLAHRKACLDSIYRTVRINWQNKTPV